MRVLIIASWYPSLCNQFAGVFVKEQIKALKTVGVTPIVFFPYDLSISPNTLKSDFEDGVLIYRANTNYLKNSKISLMNSIIKSVKFTKKIVNDNNIEIIHSHVCYPSGFVAAIFNKLYKKPYVITEHMSTINEYAQKFYNRILFDFSYKNAKKVITVSSFLKDELEKLGFKFNEKIIGNVVDVDKYYIKEKNTSENEFNIVFIGFMDEAEVKGLQYFIYALDSFIKNNSKYKVKFSIIGDGIKKKEYEKLCIDLGISENCQFYGKINKEEIPKFIAENDILVLPSIKETFGCVLIEAMAGGKPVLATKCGGPQDIVNKNVGVLVESKNVETLEKGLKEIIENYDRYDSEYIRNYAVENYGFEAIGNALKIMYENILKK